MFIAALFAIYQVGNYPNVLQWVDVDGFKKKPGYSHTMENHSAMKRTNY